MDDMLTMISITKMNSSNQACVALRLALLHYLFSKIVAGLVAFDRFQRSLNFIGSGVDQLPYLFSFDLFSQKNEFHHGA